MKTRVATPRKILSSPIQLAILTLLAGASSAQAQVQAPVQASAPAASDPNVITEVIVTGTKRSTSLQ
jgi:outer membrane receptor protein involved in Fe transport